MKAKVWLVLLLGIAFLGSGVTRQTVFSVSGRVVDAAGNGIAGVVVNDGMTFDVTDKYGRWSLMTDTLSCKFISISTPADCRLPSARGIASGFYVPVGKALAAGGHDFVLDRRTERTDSFCYVAVSDPQMRTRGDMRRWCDETVADLRCTVASLNKRREVVGIALGDLVFDNMSFFDDYASSLSGVGMTMFQCIGNHDFDSRWSDLDNMEPGTPVYAEMEYNSRFGPTDYSFNIGRAHVVTMKNICYAGNGRYVERMTDRQLAWLRKDLSYVPEGSLVILNMHAAGWNEVSKEDNMRGAERLAEVLKDYRVHVFCGHTHFFQNVQVSENLYQHNIGAASGAWWAGRVNRCGAPNGYMIVSVDGDSLTWHYKPTGLPHTRQLHVYNVGEFATRRGYVVANVWDYDKHCRVEWFQDGRPMGEMQRFTDVDESYARCCGVRKRGSETSHLFSCRPTGEYNEITVVFTNRFGERYTASVTCGV